MSMIGNFYRIDEETLHRIQRGEVLVGDILYPEDGEEDENALDIDKTWQIIHYILSGDKWDSDEDNILSKVILGGTPINEEDVGYGPALLVENTKTGIISKALDQITEEGFRKEFSLDDMLKEEIYPLVNGEGEDDLFRYAWAYFEEIKNFYREAARNNQCVLFYIN